MNSKYWVFCEVIEHGSFTAAAQQLGYSQSAVSQMVKAIETELDTVLIERRKDGIRLTRDGREFLPYFQAIRNAEEAYEHKKLEHKGLENTTINIGAFTSVSRNLLPPLMARFKEQYPTVNFVIKQGDYNTIPAWIAEGSVDFGFTNMDTRAYKEAGLKGTPLYKDELMAVVPKRHPLSRKRSVSLSDLQHESFILMDEGLNNLTLKAFEEQGLTLNPAYTIYDDYTIIAMIRQGLGVSMLYNLVVKDLVHDLPILTVKEHPSRTLGIIWKDQEAVPLAARRFARFILEDYSQYVPGSGTMQI